MSNTKRTLLSVGITGICIIAIFSFYSNFKEDKLVVIDTSSWKEYNDAKHGITVKYPESWGIQLREYSEGEVSPGVPIKIFGILLQKQKHTIIIGYYEKNNDTDKYITANPMDDPADYVTIKVGEYNLLRSTVPLFQEEGGKLLETCYPVTDSEGRVPKQKALCSSIKNDKISISFSYVRYLLDENNKYDDSLDFDPNLVREMDVILQNIIIL